MSRITYVTTEDKILSGENVDLIRKLRSGLYPSNGLRTEVVIRTWDVSETWVNVEMSGSSKQMYSVLIDADHPQVEAYKSFKDPKIPFKIVEDGVVDYDINGMISYRKPLNSIILLSSDSYVTNHKDFRKLDKLVPLYKLYVEPIEDIFKEGLMSRVLLTNRNPIKFIWHCEKLPADIVQHGVMALNEFFKFHYPDSNTEIVLKDQTGDEVIEYLKQLIN